ncbi:MAG TPA: hypothetical protein VKA09_02255 [Nitrososphaeraceae archaeon]|nr:hypothetical protein [Nitrososphaeraceae archaeon]
MKRIQDSSLMAATSLLVLFLAITATLASSPIPSYAQPAPSPPTTTLPQIATTAPGAPPIPPDLQKVLTDAQTACAPALYQIPGLPGDLTKGLCVNAVYASPKTVLVTGNLIIETTEGNQQNPFIWLAVDGFKALGYSISSIQLSGQGSQGNTHDWLIVMSKP